jgi:hypothetical protein
VDEKIEWIRQGTYWNYAVIEFENEKVIGKIWNYINHIAKCG